MIQGIENSRLFNIIMALIIFTALCFAPFSTAQAKKSKGNPKYASIVMDADSGMILSQRYADKVLHPASLTKMMTLLLAFEALDRGAIQLNDRVRISSRAASMVPSKIGLPAGSSIKVKDAILALVTKSANDIAVALAEHLGGSEYKFANMMTARARTIGMSKTRFKNASGLHNKYQVSTARDMAKMARYILQRYPHYYKYFSTKSFTYRGKTYRNHNRLMSSYKGMDGFKTGYINASGFNLVASARRDGRRLIGVVFGGRTTKTRNAHMASILDAGFKKVKNVRIASVITPPKPEAKPVYGLASMERKPALTDSKAFTSLAALNTPTKIKTAKKVSPDYTALTKALQEGAFGELIGEGDFDPAVSKRFETGLIAIAVHKGEYRPNPAPATEVQKSLEKVKHAMVSKIGTNAVTPTTKKTSTPAALPHPKDVVGKWSVQIGAYTSRTKTDEALRQAARKLPKNHTISPVSVPLRTAQGMVFRARFVGFSEKEAKKACYALRSYDCMIVAPLATKISQR
ncbi:MAG: D-alanyl-D-alanine carboxypeptidase [Alphaproteobacteria bacterium]|nr:D-alanyl-D-alanine carboxypeptidase [Alphaproteobacteria bacterium]